MLQEIAALSVVSLAALWLLFHFFITPWRKRSAPHVSASRLVRKKPSKPGAHGCHD